MKHLKPCIITLIIIALPSCTYLLRPQGLSSQYEGNYTGLDTLINIDGYYIGESTKDARKFFFGLMFYRDGSIAFDSHKLYDSEKRFVKEFVTNKKAQKNEVNWGGWGVYRISGDTIEILNTFWNDRVTRLGTAHSLFLIEGKDEIRQIESEPARLREESMHFKPYLNRIDSANWLMNKKWFYKKK